MNDENDYGEAPAEDEQNDALFEHLLNRMAIIAEQHTGNPYSHIRRVSLFSKHIATQMGLPEDTVRRIANAARLHDIGMVTVPASILKKPSRLNSAEMAIVQHHTAAGLRLIGRKNDPFLQTARAVIGGHHERWNGSGYPGGLAEDRIPVEARIVAVADTFDALCSSRPDRKPIPPEAATSVIQNAGANGLFGPAAVAGFCACKNDILDICRRYPHR